MNTELFIENRRLDITGDISTLLNFAIDDIKDFASRSTTWSKTIVLPGTANNNKLFGHIFQIGQANNYTPLLDNVNYNFNASKSADCIIFQDQMQTFKGVLRLMQINITRGQIEYEVAVFGELAGLNVALSSGFLHDLDFSEYDHTYLASGITASWANTSGTGVYYPLIDYGTYSDVSKHDWDVRTFRPALHVREYIDKMMTAANFRWTSDLFDTARFKTLIVPNNQKKLYRLTSNFLNATDGEPFTDNGSGNFLEQSTADPGLNIDFNTVKFNTITIASNFTNVSNLGTTFQYNQAGSISLRIRWRFRGKYGGSSGITDDFYAGIRKNGAGPTFSTADFINYQSAPIGTPIPTSFDFIGDFTTVLVQNDSISLFGEFVTGPPGQDCTVELLESYLIIEGMQSTLVEASPGDTINLNTIIPKNIRQIDFLSGIIKLFNLYAYESLTDSRLIRFTPYVDFYSTDSTDSIDWTYKLNRDKTLKIRPMSELTAKKYQFKFKPDSDFFNEEYRKRYGQGYGDHIFDSQFEFSESDKSFEIVFSATPLVGYSGEDKIFPTIFKSSNGAEENIDSNIRIMQSKKITGVTSWDIKDGVTVLSSQTDYGYAGHFDDPDAPSNDLNFGALEELFFTLVSGDLSTTQFNVYWSAYMAEITDKDSKLLSAWFYLTAKDILTLDFSKLIFIDGNLFRLNTIKDYNASNVSDCEVELLKVNYLIY